MIDLFLKSPSSLVYTFLIINNWLQSSYASKLCKQRHMLRIIATPREILYFPSKGLCGKHQVTTSIASYK